MRARLMILLAIAVLTSGCDIFLPREKHPVQVCGEPTPIYADDGSGRVLAWAKMCYTVWRTPGVDTTSAEGDADVEITDSTTVWLP